MSISSVPKLLPGISSLITATNELISAAAKNDKPVFITGEAGTEKALAAKLIHQLSRRADEPMTKINVSWKLPPDLSQYFERCSGGTLIINLQREFPVDMQYTIVEMTNHGSFADPLSGDTVESDARIILIASQEFSEMRERMPLLPELKDILISQHLEIPPIRNRTEDIPALVRYAIRRARDTGRSIAESVNPSVLSIFRQWEWPGNAEDLLLVTAQAAISTKSTVVKIDDLPASFLNVVPEEVIASARKIAGAAEIPESSDAIPISQINTRPDPRREGRRTDEDTQAVPLARSHAEGEPDSGEQPAHDEQPVYVSDRLLTLARRFSSQTRLLQQQFSGPLEGLPSAEYLAQMIETAEDQASVDVLEGELDRGMDMILRLRRQMALLNMRQRQNAETIRDLIQRLSISSTDEVLRDPNVGQEMRELMDSLQAIDQIVKRVSKESSDSEQSPSFFPPPKAAERKADEAEETQQLRKYKPDAPE